MREERSYVNWPLEQKTLFLIHVLLKNKPHRTKNTAKDIVRLTRKQVASRKFRQEKEATMGFEPMMRVLQTLALPLGHVA